MVRVTCCTPEAPEAICVGVKLQPTVASGRPVHAKVTSAANVDPLVGVTVKVEVVDAPESTGPGGVGFDKEKVGAVMVSVSAVDVLDPLFASPA